MLWQPLPCPMLCHGQSSLPMWLSSNSATRLRIVDDARSGMTAHPGTALSLPAACDPTPARPILALKGPVGNASPRSPSISNYKNSEAACGALTKRGAVLVYVDNAFVERHGHQWCHLLADSVEELHQFAAAVGLSMQAFHRAARIPHYDVTAKQRLLMLAKGVRPVTVRQGILHTKHLTPSKVILRAIPAQQQELYE